MLKLLLAPAVFLLTYSCQTAPSPVPQAKPYKMINLTWQASSTSSVTYNLYRKVNAGAYTLLSNTPSTAYSDTSIARKTKYCYVVKSLKVVESIPSNEFCITTI